MIVLIHENNKDFIVVGSDEVNEYLKSGTWREALGPDDRRILMDEWIAALSSGEWKQEKNMLCSNRFQDHNAAEHPPTFCCLGVLERLIQNKTGIGWENTLFADGEVLHESIWRWFSGEPLDITSGMSFMFLFTRLNDNMEMDFANIGKLLATNQIIDVEEDY